MNRFTITFAAAVLAYMVAIDLGSPTWRTLPAGDASDFGIVTAILVWHLLKEFRRGNVRAD